MHGPRQAAIAKLPDGQINRLSRTDVQPYSKKYFVFGLARNSPMNPQVLSRQEEHSG
jgi:hypothetical protein